MAFQKAQRKRAKLRLGISGVSNSGKTWSALEIATGMSGKIAMIDTESGRGELYGEDFDYDVMRLDAPYSPDKYIAAIKEAEALGYDILIIDSLSHAWAGEGGVLSIADKVEGNKFTNGWKIATPKQNALVDAITHSSLHIIFTMRTKTEYVLETDSRGKQVPKKVGMAPVQRDGLEYECTFYLEMYADHTAYISKDNTKLYKDNQYGVTPTKEMGKKLIEWLNSGKSQDEVEKESFNKALSSILDQINGAESLEDLKDKYMSLQHSYKNNPKLIEELVAAKEQRKMELEGVKH
jgi:hypothetical protein